jgi:hypothetical protein
MQTYHVWLFEDDDASEPILFECSADDAEHAEEQAVNAYPRCHIDSISKLIEIKG